VVRHVRLGVDVTTEERRTDAKVQVRARRLTTVARVGDEVTGVDVGVETHVDAVHVAVLGVHAVVTQDDHREAEAVGSTCALDVSAGGGVHRVADGQSHVHATVLRSPAGTEARRAAVAAVVEWVHPAVVDHRSGAGSDLEGRSSGGSLRGRGLGSRRGRCDLHGSSGQLDHVAGVDDVGVGDLVGVEVDDVSHLVGVLVGRRSDPVQGVTRQDGVVGRLDVGDDRCGSRGGLRHGCLDDGLGSRGGLRSDRSREGDIRRSLHRDGGDARLDATAALPGLEALTLDSIPAGHDALGDDDLLDRRGLVGAGSELAASVHEPGAGEELQATEVETGRVGDVPTEVGLAVDNAGPVVLTDRRGLLCHSSGGVYEQGGDADQAGEQRSADGAGAVQLQLGQARTEIHDGLADQDGVVREEVHDFSAGVLTCAVLR